LAQFNCWHASRVLTARTVLMIVSDGYDTGEPGALGSAMATLHKRCRRIVWLNPMIGWAGYEPVARGMLEALPNVDLFAPAHTLESLTRLEPFWQSCEDPMMDRGTDVLDLANGLKAHGEVFAIATVVRTVAATAAKAGRTRSSEPMARSPPAGSAVAAPGPPCSTPLGRLWSTERRGWCLSSPPMC
jgi:hypothetical protein